MEFITKIEEFDEDYAGFRIHTSHQVVELSISTTQDCCESWGYFLTEDNTEKFVGSILLDVSVTDTALRAHDVPEVYEGDTMFVNVHTSEGLLQFVAYNAHNGYYGHRARVVSRQCEYEDVL